MLIGGDDMVHAFMLFSVSAYIHTCFHFALIGRNLTAHSTGSHRPWELVAEFKFQRHSCKLSFLFLPCAATSAPQTACLQLG